MLRNLLLGTSAYMPLYAADGASAGGATEAPAGEGSIPATQTETPTGDATTDGGGATPKAAEGGDTTTATGTEPAGDGGDAEPTHKPDWRDRQLAKRNNQLAAERESKARLEAEIAELRAKLEAGSQPAATTATTTTAPATTETTTPQRHQYKTEAEFNAAVDDAAAKKVQETEFRRQFNQTLDAGKKVYGEHWQTALDRLQAMGDVDGATLMGIMATDDPARVLYTLGTRPEEYERIMGLDGARRIAEFTKMAIAPKVAPKKPSGAPPPVETINTRNSSDPTALNDELSEEEWRARRTAQKQGSKGRAWSPRAA